MADVATRLAAVRADDQALTGAIAALEADLTNWLTEVARLQDQLRVALGASDGLAASDESSPPDPAPPEAVAEVEANAVTEAVEPAPRGKMFVEPVTSAPPERIATASVVEEPSPPGGNSDDDEKLLASLDSQTATAIRVRRRLAGNRKSVRELLDELRAAKPEGPSQESKKKKWWS